MKKKIGSVLWIVVAFAIYAKANETDSSNAIQTGSQSSVEIVVCDGTVVLKMRQGVDFPCIGIQFSDRKFNTTLGTYLEVKRQGDLYVVKVNYDMEFCSTMDQAIETYLKELFRHFYENKDPEYGKKVWKAFVEEGGLLQFIDTAKDWIDDGFLDSPFNERYG